MATYLERVLLVVGPQNAGKSVQLWSMFRDVCFGTQGEVPQARNLSETYRLTHDRWLDLRLTSPHEYGDTMETWLDKIDQKIGDGRWSIAGALQPEVSDKVSDVVECVNAVLSRFNPDRIRCAFLSPDRHGDHAARHYPINHLLKALQQLQGVETMLIDARSRKVNGLLLADFFDFS